MKIYIDWDRIEWDIEEGELLKKLVKDCALESYSDFLAGEYIDRYDELLNLSEEEKSDLKFLKNFFKLLLTFLNMCVII